MNMCWKLTFAGVIAALMGAAGATSHAALIAYEGFNYGAGTLVGQSGGIGWSSGWSSSGGTAEVAEPGYNYPLLPTIGNKAFVSASNLNTRVLDVVDPLGQGATEDGTVWISVIGQRANTQTRLVWFALYESEVSDPKVLIGEPHNDAANVWKTQFGGSGVPGPVSDVPINDETLLLMRIDFNADANDDFFLWLNPDLSEGEPTIASDSYVGSESGFDLAFDTIALRAGTTSGGQAGAIWFDEIRVGSDFASVVPEPGAIVLTAFGLAGVCLLARRKRG